MKRKGQRQEYWLGSHYKIMKNYSIIILLIIIAGCAVSNKLQPGTKEISSMQQKVPGISLEKAMQGYVLYKTNCSSCHSLYIPDQFTISQWEKILPVMFERAKISSLQDRQLINDYLFSKSK